MFLSVSIFLFVGIMKCCQKKIYPFVTNENNNLSLIVCQNHKVLTFSLLILFLSVVVWKFPSKSLEEHSSGNVPNINKVFNFRSQDFSISLDFVILEVFVL